LGRSRPERAGCRAPGGKLVVVTPPEAPDVPDAPTVVDNSERNRFELRVGDETVGFVVYRPLRPQVIALVHTEIDSAHEGHGYGSTLIAGALDQIRARGLEVQPDCPFVRKYIAEHPDEADLVAPGA
jgi:predicted GNAT family acetyltransferase